MSTIDDERAAFIRDLLRVLTSLYSWAGAVVHGQTEDGHDVIELCDKTLVFTAAMNMDPWWEACMVFAHHGGNRSKRPNPIGDINSYSSRERMIRYVASWAVADLVEYRIRDLLTGPPEDA